MNRGRLVVFAKQPETGQVKTRMAPPLSLEEAAALYRMMLADVLEVSARAARDLDLEAVLAVHPAAAAGELAASAPPGFAAVAQRGGDLSQRMDHAVREAAASGAPCVLMRGSDSPALGPEVVAEALAALESADLVICPDRDGGYNLVGLRAPVPGLFDHAMSTDRVAEDTLARAERAGVRTCVLAPRFDLDTIEDLHWLALARADGALAAICPRTLAWIDAHDLWRHVSSASLLAPVLEKR